MAEAFGKGGQAEEGLAMLAEALAILDEHDIRFNEAELWRLKGELLLKRLDGGERWPMALAEPVAVPEVEGPALSEAEACFRQALDTAHRQRAKSLELRAAIGLSRLWQLQGKAAVAHELLAEIHGWFTEGFDTTDLQAANALLDPLG